MIGVARDSCLDGTCLRLGASTAPAAPGQTLITRYGTLVRLPVSFPLRSDNGLAFPSHEYTRLVRSSNTTGYRSTTDGFTHPSVGASPGASQGRLPKSHMWSIVSR